MVCAWCELEIEGKPVELHRGPIPFDWRKYRAKFGTARAITAAGEAFASTIRAMQGDKIEHYNFHAECWDHLARLLNDGVRR